jgi:hypothetical protein
MGGGVRQGINSGIGLGIELGVGVELKAVLLTESIGVFDGGGLCDSKPVASKDVDNAKPL